MSHNPRFSVRQGDEATTVERMPDGRVRVEGAASPFTVECIGPGRYRVADDTRHWLVAVSGPADGRHVSVDGLSATVDVVSAGAPVRAGRRRGHGDASAPMPATVIAIHVEPGQAVEAGAVLLKLEAMKMELPIRAPRAGIVGAIHCRLGELVQAGIVLVDLQ